MHNMKFVTHLSTRASLQEYRLLERDAVLLWLDSPHGPRPPSCRGFEITTRHTTLGKTPLDEISAPGRDLYLTTHNIHKRQTSMPPAGFEPAIPASKRPQTHALHRAATGIGRDALYSCKFTNLLP